MNSAISSESSARAVGRGGRWVTPAGIALLLLGIGAAFMAARRQGHDFACVYMTALGVVEKLPIYDFAWQRTAFPTLLGTGVPQGMFYPPGTGVGILPLALLPYPVAHTVWFVLMCGGLVLGVRALLLLVRPAAASQWPLVAGLVLLSSAVRWGMTPQQGAPLILGLLAMFALALHRQQFIVALLLAAFAVSFKTTLSLPFLGLFFLYRRYAFAAGAVGCMVLFNVVGFVRLGGMSAWRAYQSNVATLEAFGDINTPDPWEPVSVPRIDWTYLFNGLTRNLAFSRLAALGCAAVVGLWLLWQARRVQSPTLPAVGAFMLAFACLTNLSVYHHHYDLSVVIAPLLLLWLGAPELRGRGATLSLIVPLAAIMAVLPIAQVQRLVTAYFGAVGRGLLNLSLPLALTLTLIAAMVTIQRLAAPSPQKLAASASRALEASGAGLASADKPFAER